MSEEKRNKMHFGTCRMNYYAYLSKAKNQNSHLPPFSGVISVVIFCAVIDSSVFIFVVVGMVSPDSVIVVFVADRS